MRFGFGPYVAEIVSCGFGIGIATNRRNESRVLSPGGLTFFCSRRASNTFKEQDATFLTRVCVY